MNPEGKVAFVTGGSSGLGAAVVESLLAFGSKVMVMDIQEPQPEVSCAYFKGDITQEEDVSNAVQETIRLFGAIHINVNCAGIAPAKKILGKHGLHDLATFKKTIDINLSGSFLSMAFCAEQMQKNLEEEKGVIIHTASAAAFEGQIGQTAYAASKGAIASMILPAARELASHGIRVNAIAPGVFQTPLFNNLPPQAVESLGKLVPFPSRLGKPSEFASFVLHIISNQMLNGAVLRIDGALRMN